MDRLEQLRQQKKEKIEAMEAILQKATDETRDITDEETKQYDAMEKEIDALNVSIAREEKLEAEKAALRKIVNPISQTLITVQKNASLEDFKTMGEFMHSVRFFKADPRLEFHEGGPTTEEQRLHSMGTGTDGGFMVPKQFMDTILSVPADVAAFRPRARVLPAGTPPDSEITIPALDQTSSQNMYGGMTMSWTAEGGTKQETNARLREVKLSPKEASGYVTVTDKLLRNAPAAGTLLTGLMRDAMMAFEETAFYSGNGVGKPLGVLNNPARITYGRATVNTIVYADVVGMYARMLRRAGNPVWIYNQTALPQLMTMVDPGSGGTVIWQRSAREGEPATLLGIPAITNERVVALGTTGDLILVNMSYYLIKDGSGPFVAASEHVNFINNKTVIKIFWNVDGQSWLTAPLPLEGTPSNTVSPFVILG